MTTSEKLLLVRMRLGNVKITHEKDRLGIHRSLWFLWGDSPAAYAWGETLQEMVEMAYKYWVVPWLPNESRKD